jgi:hypothetical protein
LIDRLLALAKAREENRDKWLELMKSLYQELVGIHTDYLSFLTRAQTDLRRGLPIREVLDVLIERRLRLEPARRSLRAIAAEFGQPAVGWPRERTWFFQALGRYVDTAANVSMPGTISESVIDLIERALRSGELEETVRADFQTMLQEALDVLRERFAGVAGTHAMVHKQAF